jgi:diguanylate cyclase (GGDEF)-like protein
MTLPPYSSVWNVLTRRAGKPASADAVSKAGLPGLVRDRCMYLITIVASIGLALALLFSMGSALFTSTATSAAVSRAIETRSLSVYYVNARFAIAAEESLVREYRLQPAAGVARAHAAAAQALTSALESIARNAPPANAAEALRLLKLQQRYLAASRHMFAAIDARDATRALTIEHRSIDPLFSEIEHRVYARGGTQRRASGAGFDSLRLTQAYVVHLEIALSILGLACLLGFLFVIYAYRYRLISSHAVEVQRMEEAVLVDSLTKIGNHRAFKEDIQREMALAARHAVPLTLAMLDIDEFKQVNDQNGHAHGDRVLFELAKILREGRAGDRAYRVGGDEFALILPHTPASASRSALERIRIAASKKLYGSTVSIGYSTVDDFDINVAALLNQADAALYVAKRGGRNGVSQFDASNTGTSVISTERVKSLRALLASGTLPIAFQPIWDLGHAEILAFEALLRPSASFGFAGPQDAFDLAERIGCAHELDRASWLAALRRAGELPAGALLFLNVSPQTLDRNFDVEEFTASIAAFGLRPERVVLEITERSIAHIDNVIAIARSLKAAGFGIALDDTGAGHAGLEIMSRLQFDYVKIDRAIIVKAMVDRNASGVVAAIVAFAQVTGAYVIAEGIEDIAMLDFIDGAGCARASVGRGIRGAQGYLLRRPSETLPSARDILDVSALLGEHVVHDEPALSRDPHEIAA